MGVVNLEKDTRIESKINIHEFAHRLQQLDIESIPPELRAIAVLRQITRIAAGEARSPVDQRRLIANYLEAAKNEETRQLCNKNP